MYLLIPITLLVLKLLKSAENLYTHPFNPVAVFFFIFFILLTGKFPEVFPIHKG